MNIFLTLAIFVVNSIAILIAYQFLRKIDNKGKLIIIAIGIAVNYMLLLCVYGLSSIGMNQEISNKASNFIIYMFVPINLIINIPYFASSYTKLKEQNITKEKFKKRILVIVIITIIILVAEYFYFKNIQGSVANMIEK